MKLHLYAFLLAILPSLAFAASPETFLYVQVRQSKLRQQPQFWASSVADLTYGTKLVSVGVAESSKSWLKVKLNETEGYVPVSAVTKRKVILSSAAAPDKSVDTGSVVLAGKGFNRQVENQYASSKNLDFKPVDEVEQYTVEPSEGSAFVTAGKLANS